MTVPKSLGGRMKDYEGRSDLRLQRKLPVLARLDGKAFHTLTRGLATPHPLFAEAMWRTALALCDSVQGCKLAYVQSDEITLLLTDWASHSTAAWFDYRVQKMCSVAGGIAANAFNQAWFALFGDAPRPPATFDARFWNIAPGEVNNAFLWRQRDATKNSVQMLGRAHFSHRQLHKKTGSDIQDMLMQLDPPLNWNDCPVWQKRGVCVVKEPLKSYLPPPADADYAPTERTRWVVDKDIPIFSKAPEYIEARLAWPGT